MAIVKLGSDSDVNKTTITGGRYEGPVPPKNFYKGVVRQMKLGKTGPKAKTPDVDRIEILVSIIGGDYEGYSIWHGFNLTDDGKPYFNQFLQAITNGTDKEMVSIRKAFWDKVKVGEEPDKRGYVDIERWGKWKVEDGLVVGFYTKMGTNFKTKEPQAEIAKFVNKKPPQADKDTPLEGLGEFASDDDLEDAVDLDEDDTDDESPWED